MKTRKNQNWAKPHLKVARSSDIKGSSVQSVDDGGGTSPESGQRSSCFQFPLQETEGMTSSECHSVFQDSPVVCTSDSSAEWIFEAANQSVGDYSSYVWQVKAQVLSGLGYSLPTPVTIEEHGDEAARAVRGEILSRKAAERAAKRQSLAEIKNLVFPFSL